MEIIFDRKEDRILLFGVITEGNGCDVAEGVDTDCAIH